MHKQGQRPGGTGGTVPQEKCEVGDDPCIRSPNILRSSVVVCARKYEQSKKGVIKEFFSEIVVVLVRKGSYGTWWRLGSVDIFQPEGRGFDSRSSRPCKDLGQVLYLQLPVRFGVKLRDSIRAVVVEDLKGRYRNGRYE